MKTLIGLCDTMRALAGYIRDTPKISALGPWPLLFMLELMVHLGKCTRAAVLDVSR